MVMIFLLIFCEITCKYCSVSGEDVNLCFISAILCETEHFYIENNKKITSFPVVLESQQIINKQIVDIAINSIEYPKDKKK